MQSTTLTTAAEPTRRDRDIEEEEFLELGLSASNVTERESETCPSFNSAGRGVPEYTGILSSVSIRGGVLEKLHWIPCHGAGEV